MKKPLVSVVMITYAHENFIEQAVNSILMQNCTFEVELIIADDNSPDKTKQIVLDTIKNNPNGKWIKYTKHQINKGMMPNFIWALGQCNGKYIAMCEGDDYWTDPYKLQKQVDFLEKNEEYCLCFHDVKITNNNIEFWSAYKTMKKPYFFESIEDFAKHGNFIHTPSVVFRNLKNESFSFPQESIESPAGDIWLYLLLMYKTKKKIKFIDEEMAVYRYGVGVWSKDSELKKDINHFVIYSLLSSYFERIGENYLSKILESRTYYTFRNGYNRYSINDLDVLFENEITSRMLLKNLLFFSKEEQTKSIDYKKSSELLKILIKRFANKVKF